MVHTAVMLGLQKKYWVPWLKTGAIYYYTQLGLTDKARAVTVLVVCGAFDHIKSCTSLIF